MNKTPTLTLWMREALVECRKHHREQTTMGPWRKGSMIKLAALGLVEGVYDASGRISHWHITKAGLDYPL